MRVVKVTAAQILWARLIVDMDREDGIDTDEAIVRIAATPLRDELRKAERLAN